VARRARWVAGWVAVLVSLAAALAGAVLGGRWVARSPRFDVTSVEVTGQSRMSREAILAAAGIPARVNLFALDPRAVVARLEALPVIRRAEVIRTFPNRLTVIVEERRPFTLVHAGRLYWVDEEGMELGAEPRAVALQAPVLSGLGPDDLGGERRGAASERAVLGIALLRLLHRADSPLLRQISEVDLSRPEGPVLYTVDGIEVRVGKEDWEARFGRLQGVLAQLSASGETVASIDLRFRDQVVLKPPVR
jgi:cell division protein FtsQ